MKIDEFREKIAKIRPQNFMALGGAASGIVGTSNTGADVTMQLQRAVIDFTKLYKAATDEAQLEAKRQQIEGFILMEATVDAITQKFADELLSDLDELMKERK